jgi:hypothetical protein
VTQAVAAGYGGVSAAPNSEQNQSWVVPVAAVGLTGLGVAAIISGVAISKRHSSGRCFQRAAERLFENRLTYTEEGLREALLELTIRKFQQEGSGTIRMRRLQPGLSRSEVEPAARASMLKSLRRGLSPRKMERFLNEHVRRLREISPPSLRASLRDFDAHKTAGADLSTIGAAKLFPCDKGERYIVLSYQKFDKMRKGDPAHFDPILHDGNRWVIANTSPEFLVRGSATPEDAKRALDEFARRKYGSLRRNGVYTIFSERA